MIKTKTLTVREHTYHAGPDTDTYLAVDVGKIQVDDGFKDGDEVEVTISIRKVKVISLDVFD